jgi:hypothetical protein
MSESNTTVHESKSSYECGGCREHFEVVMTFREQEPFDRDEHGRTRPAGYPEQQPECPMCHSHDVVRVEIRAADRMQETKCDERH